MVEYRIVRLWADRVRMVKKYLESPSIWPDGIDTKYERWYSGHEDYWRERVGHWVDGRWAGGVGDEAAYASWAGAAKSEAKAVEGEPWVEAGVSRATWYRRKAEED